MQPAPQLVGEQLVSLLEYYGVTTVFGIPGVHTIELYRGLNNASIRHITPRHEQGAGFMADGFARATGSVGVCFCITGPGMTNIATPMGQAYADSIPMLVISSVNKTSTLGKGLGRLHELKNQTALIAGVSAFSHTVLSTDELPDVLARAFAVFSSARPRPVHIEIPIDLIAKKASAIRRTPGTLPAKPGPDPDTVSIIADRLVSARKKAVLIGGGCVDAQEPVQQFVDLISAPTCLTINARGLLPPEHPMLLDGVQTIDEFRDYIEDCDVVIAIGTELGETDYDFYDTGPLKTYGALIRIDIDPLQLSNNATTTIGLVSDAGLALSALCQELQKNKSLQPQDSSVAVVERINNALQNQYTEPSKQYDELLQAITTAHPKAIIVGDSTKPIYHANFAHRAPAPRHWFNSATGFGTLGYALPAAIGAKLGIPQSPVIAITGDGGFQFTLNELVVAVQEKVAIAIVIWNNNGYKEINDFMERNKISPLGVDVQGPNVKLLAQAMGAEYARAEHVSDIAKLLMPLPEMSVPLIIEHITNIDA